MTPVFYLACFEADTITNSPSTYITTEYMPIYLYIPPPLPSGAYCRCYCRYTHVTMEIPVSHRRRRLLSPPALPVILPSSSISCHPKFTNYICTPEEGILINNPYATPRTISRQHNALSQAKACIVIPDPQHDSNPHWLAA